MAGVAELNDQNFEAEVVQSGQPAIVDFWAEWCAPCKAIAPIISQLAGEYGDRVKVVKVNIDENPNTPARYGIRAIPTILAFNGGQVVGQLQGARPRSAFEEMIKKLL